MSSNSKKWKGLISKLNADDLTRQLGQGPANLLLDLFSSHRKKTWTNTQVASTRCCCRIASRSTKPRFRKDENCCSNCLCCADRIADSAPKSTTPRTSRVKMTTTLNNLLRRFKRLKLCCFLDLFDFTQYRPYIRFSITHLLLWAALDNLLHGPLVSLCVCACLPEWLYELPQAGLPGCCVRGCLDG